jgi:hypothetical protein
MNPIGPRSSPHLVRAIRESYSKTPPGRVALFVTTAHPGLRPFKGVILQYLQRMSTCIHAEGKQAVARYKSYKSGFLEVVATGILPPRKYRHAMPLYKVALRFRDDPSILGGLHTVFRFYDLYTPPQSLIDEEMARFTEQFTVSDLDHQEHNQFVIMEDEVFDFNGELRNLISHPAFKEFSKKVPFFEAYRPQEKAILLSKHGTATFKKSFTPKRVKGYAPSIVGATAELEAAFKLRLRSGESLYDLLVSLGSAIGTHSWPSMRFKYVDPPPEGNLSAELRRNVCFGAPGFKSRVIAIGDYFSQYVLSPLHDWAFNVLRSISSDYTFSHESGFRSLSEFTRDKDYVACFDLSNATDAIPVALSECILSFLAPNGQVIAPLWRRVLTEVPFQGRYYRVGQPMGLLSSWSVGLALTHHCIVWIAAYRAGILSSLLKSPKDFYGIVGDDVFICHPRLAHYYLLIMGALGCKINLTKSLLVSNDRRVSEFVKRNSFNGDEITALSPRLITKSFSDYVCARELILRMRERVLIGPRQGSASSIDEKALLSLYQCIGSGFTRAAIGTMCSIPTIYAGLAELNSDNAQWPPLSRIQFLSEKALVLLEYHLRSIYINASGADTFNELVNWSLEDLVPENYFRQTQLVEFIRKQTMEAENLLGIRGLESNHLMAELAQTAFSLISERLDANGFDLWEIDYHNRLLSFVKPPHFATKEVARKETRSLAYKVFKSVKDKSEPNGSALESRINRRLIRLLSKFSFELPSLLSQEEMYEKLFGAIPEDHLIQEDLSNYDN